MVDIDIIDYSAAQYAAMTKGQLQEVQATQLRKNRLTREYNRKVKNEKKRLITNGTYSTELWAYIQANLQTEYESKVEDMRKYLLFYLHYSMQAGGAASDSAPYEVDYSLTEPERYTIVKLYYETAYTDVNERFQAFCDDEVAVQYLGEFYATLYDYFLEDIV